VLAAHHLLDFSGLDFRLERAHRVLQVAADVLARFRPLEQDAEIVELLDDGVAEGGFVSQTAPPLQEPLRFGLILPEIGRRDTGLERGQFARRISRVKDSSAGLEPVWSSLRNDG
jgi:hypothetical protein